jgi:hypothetical protein
MNSYPKKESARHSKAQTQEQYQNSISMAETNKHKGYAGQLIKHRATSSSLLATQGNAVLFQTFV